MGKSSISMAISNSYVKLRSEVAGDREGPSERLGGAVPEGQRAPVNPGSDQKGNVEVIETDRNGDFTWPKVRKSAARARSWLVQKSWDHKQQKEGDW